MVDGVKNRWGTKTVQLDEEVRHAHDSCRLARSCCSGFIMIYERNGFLAFNLEFDVKVEFHRFSIMSFCFLLVLLCENSRGEYWGQVAWKFVKKFEAVFIVKRISNPGQLD